MKGRNNKDKIIDKENKILDKDKLLTGETRTNVK